MPVVPFVSVVLVSLFLPVVWLSSDITVAGGYRGFSDAMSSHDEFAVFLLFVVRVLVKYVWLRIMMETFSLLPLGI